MNPEFPPYGLTFTPTGDPGRAGGLTWLYTAMQRGDLFHIYWLVCDDPATPCGLSLDGPIDVPAEQWTLSITDTDLPNGKLVFTNTTHIALADTSLPQLNGRLDGVDLRFERGADLVLEHRRARRDRARRHYGAEIKGSAFKVTVLPRCRIRHARVDAGPSTTTTPRRRPTGGGATQSFDGEFYDK